MKKVICYTDGNARSNPGLAAIGVYITDENEVMMGEVGQSIGNSTNNFAQYQAVLVGLQTLLMMFGDEMVITEVEIRLASELIKKQLNGETPINEPGFVPMFIEIHNMRVVSFPHITFTLISPEENTEANRLVNEALEAK